MSLTVQVVSGQQDEVRWDSFVRSHPDATGYHLIAWGRILADMFGHRTVYLFASEGDGTVRGVLPLCLLSSRLFGTFAASLPAVNYGGVVADDANARSLLLDAAMDIVKKFSATHLELRQVRALDIDWPCKQNKVSMRLHLPGHYDALWANYPSKLRSQIRRAQKEGLTTRVGGIELVGDFYSVFSRNMRDLGTPVYSKRLFHTILTVFPREARICAVYLQDQPVAAGFLYGFRDMMEIPWASSDRRYTRAAPNMLLYGAVLEYACEQGYRVFDFGRSSKDSGTYRFKEQWGANPVQLNWYYWLKNGVALPELNPQNQKYALAIRVWQHLPLSATTLVGPMIAKYLP